MKLTKDSVASIVLPLGKQDAIVFDDELKGFGLRLRSGGRLTWICQFRAGNQQRRITIGDARKVDADRARKTAKAHLAKATLGHDPAAEKAAEHARAKVTVGAVVELYLAFKRGDHRDAKKRPKKSLKPKTMHDLERHLLIKWKPLHKLPVHKVERRDVAARLAEVNAESGGYAADQAKFALSAMFAWAMREGFCEANPAMNTNTYADREARDRVLEHTELAAVWDALPAGDYGRIVKLLILTGQRREEIAALRWSEVDLDKRLITLPGNRTKNGLPHEVPLSDSAIDVLRECPHRADRDLIFGAKGPFSGFAKCKAALDAAIAKARGGKLVPWRLHDVRRTVATKLGEDLGVQPHVVEAILNHVSGHKAGVAGVYNYATYRKEKTQALTAWADHVKRVTEGGPAKVVPLRSGEGTA